LNAKNKKYLADSLTNIQAVLDSAGTTEESIKDVDEIDYDKGEDDGIDIVTDTVDNIVIDEAKDEVTIEEINEAIERSSRNREEKLDYLLGRVKQKKQKGSDL